MTKSRVLASVLLGSGVFLTPETSRATGLLSPVAATGPSTIDVTAAVAVTPYGSTRWTRLTLSGGSSETVMWLVPARPGAEVDTASDAWLDALDNATAPRIVPAKGGTSCPTSVERVATFGSIAAKRPATSLAVLATEADARAHAAARGFEISAAQSPRVAAIYATGAALVALEVTAPAGAARTTPTIRVNDDGDALVPLALTGSPNARVRVTAFVISQGPSTLEGAVDIDPRALVWGPSQSNYAVLREQRLASGGGDVWLRESSAKVLVAGLAVPRSEPTPPVVAGYLADASCISKATAASGTTGGVGRMCPPGVLARVPGAASCAPQEGAIDASSFSCGSGMDDLALSLAGLAPRDAFVSRFAGIVPAQSIGSDVSITTAVTSAHPILYAGGMSGCNEAPPPSSAAPPSGSSGQLWPEAPPPPRDEGRTRYLRSGGCGGGTTTVVTSDDSSSDDSSSDDSSSDDSSSDDSSSSTSNGESCSSDSSTSSNDGWDSSDDDSCGGGSSSDSDDSCSGSSSSGGSSSGDSDDGWDSSDVVKTRARGAPPTADSKGGSVPRGPTSSKAKKKKRSSPVSRMALLAVAIILPLRRLRREH